MENIQPYAPTREPYRVRCPKCDTVFAADRASTRDDGRVWLQCGACLTWAVVTLAKG